ncbi:MAG: hypothetical protein HN522_04210 [Flavobacteriales bacterium]|jgi:hypothetical protein|nr:hypothetical protein [Flavobacteriales bacterium]MBT6169796.1 hypothetical protein [Flavobacteriaceae bacterium]
MNTEFKILLRKGSVFILPIIAWICIVVAIDPFNYFNLTKIISQQSKEKSAQKLNSLLYNSLHFKNHPTTSIIIGDSRIRRLPIQKIKELTGDDYYTLHSNAAKLNEIIDLFWLTNKYTKLENVIIGLNFNLYNEYAYSNRVADVQEMIRNPLIYIFNWNIAETIYLALKNELFGVQKNNRLNKEKFWEHKISTFATNQYSKYRHPDSTLKRLREVGAYCLKNKINLNLIIVPHHKEFHDRLVDFKLTREEIQFKEEIRHIGRVIDFDYPNSITNCKSCFTDPIHTNDSISEIIVNDIFTDSLVVGKLLQ